MNNKSLLGALAAVLVMTAACGSSTNTNANKSAASPSPATASSSPTPAAASSPVASTEGKQDFTLVNETGVEIDKVFISPHDSDDWEADILGQDTLPSGQKVDIKFHRDEKAANWDLKIEDNKGNSIEWANLNLLEISKVTLHYKDGKGTAETE